MRNRTRGFNAIPHSDILGENYPQLFLLAVQSRFFSFSAVWERFLRVQANASVVVGLLSGRSLRRGLRQRCPVR